MSGLCASVADESLRRQVVAFKEGCSVSAASSACTPAMMNQLHANIVAPDSHLSRTCLLISPGFVCQGGIKNSHPVFLVPSNPSRLSTYSVPSWAREQLLHVVSVPLAWPAHLTGCDTMLLLKHLVTM